jgi:hypothetical protein
MKNRDYIALSLFSVMLLLGLLTFEVQDNAPISTKSSTVQSPINDPTSLVQKVFWTPVNFYGKVIDQNGDPVPHAHIKYAVSEMGAYNGLGSIPPHVVYGESDSKGCFAMLDTQRTSIFIYVSKPGYYCVNEKSNRNSSEMPESDVDSPVFFLLWKKGLIEPLIKNEQSIDISLNKGPLDAYLVTGSAFSDVRVDLSSEIIPLDNRVPMRRYHWSCNISIPNGGLQERPDLYVTTAPASNYRSYVAKSISADDPMWTDSWKGNYFVHLPGDYHARMLIEVAANQGVYPRVRIISYTNPQKGSRNLDSDDELPYDY